MTWTRRLPELAIFAVVVAGLVGPIWLPSVPPPTCEDLLAHPSWAHPLGTDDSGHDLLAMLICGARTAVFTALFGVALAVAIGLPLGALAGYLGGSVDVLLLRVVEVFSCFPKLFLVLAVGAFVGPSTGAIVAVLGLLGWTAFARIVRGELLSLREREFVLVARSLGVGVARVLVRHALPSAKGPVLVAAAFACADAVAAEATISFLGLGPGLQVPSWGSLLHQGRLHAAEGHWHLWVFPTLALVATVWSLHCLADRWSFSVTGAGARVPDSSSVPLP